MPQDTGDSPLAALRVLDLADEKAGFGARLLADLGAEVIKVEPPGGDASRRRGPFQNNTPHPEKSLPFWYHNAGKLGITLSLESGRGRDIFMRLVRSADAVVETFPPGYLDGLGLGYSELSRQNPKIILASITGFGQTGPHSSYKSADIVASAAGGQMHVSGSPATPPLKPCGQQSYYAASLFAASGILLARREQRRSGRGQHIDISLQEAVAATLEHVMVRYFYDKVVPTRQGNLHWTNSACLLPCRDGYMFITFGREWETLLELLDSEGMAADLKEARWRDGGYRRQNASHIVDVLSAWTRTHTTGELFKMGQLMRFPWAPACSLPEVCRSPQLRERRFFTPIEHPQPGRSFDYPGVPGRFSTLSWRIRGRAPSIGEHNALVYGERLMISEQEIKDLEAANVI